MTTLVQQPASQRTQRLDRHLAPKRLLIVDDHPAVRTGLRQLLNDEADFQVVATAATAEDGIEVAERERIDVAVVDYQLRGRSGLWLSRKLKRLAEPPAVIIYSAYTGGVLSAAAVVAEADAIVNKGTLGRELCEAIRVVASGERRLPTPPPWLAETLRRRLDHEQQAIFGMLLASINPTEVAYVLGLSAASLESQLWEVLRRIEDLPAVAKVHGPSETGRQPR
jgi:DNA-binding NarL/FixJ family response regulator